MFVFATLFLIPSSNLVSAPSVASVYWSEDDGTGEIFSADLATQTVTQITSGGFDRIDDVELDALHAKLWWNNWDPGTPSATEGLWESNLDGTGQMQRLSGLQNSCAPGELQTSGLTGIVLDPANQQVFFTRGVSYANCPDGEVSRVNMDGTGYTILHTGSWHPDGIDLSGGTVYWANPGILTGSSGFGPVNTMDTAGGNKVLDQLPQIIGDGRSVAVDSAKALLFYSAHGTIGVPGRSTGGEIFVVDLNNVAAGATNVLSDLTTGIPDVELDTANMRIYWTDYTNGLIRSASYDAAGNLGAITNEISGLTQPYGLALRFLTQGVGGEYFTLDTTALLVAGLQTNLAWIIPVAVSTVGIGAFLLRKKF